MIDLSEFNPWWRSGSVPPALLGKERRLLAQIVKDMGLRQIQILSGIRRAGKTTLLFQIIDWLIRVEKIHPHNILYFSFDVEVEEFDEIMQSYEQLVIKRSYKEIDRLFVVLDEVRKLPDWANRIKRLYDLNPNVKLVLSGSAALHLKQGTRESLAGRFFDVKVSPLGFDEYLEFVDVEVDKAREDLYEADLRRHFDSYIETGGFIEAFDFDALQRAKYFRESLLERVIYMDLPSAYAIRSPDLLYRLLKIIAERPGIYLDYHRLANDLKYDQRTIADYLQYLENSLLVRRVYNYSATQLTSEKKMKRAYLTSTAFSKALSPGVGRGPLFEQHFVSSLEAVFFWRTPRQDEVDIIVASDAGPVPIEVKIAERFDPRDAGAVFKFMNQFDVTRGVLVSDKAETDLSRGANRISVIPYWKYWTLQRALDVTVTGE